MQIPTVAHALHASSKNGEYLCDSVALAHCEALEMLVRYCDDQACVVGGFLQLADAEDLIAARDEFGTVRHWIDDFQRAIADGTPPGDGAVAEANRRAHWYGGAAFGSERLARIAYERAAVLFASLLEQRHPVMFGKLYGSLFDACVLRNAGGDQ